jgi:hypothetical protein
VIRSFTSEVLYSFGETCSHHDLCDLGLEPANHCQCRPQ